MRCVTGGILPVPSSPTGLQRWSQQRFSNVVPPPNPISTSRADASPTLMVRAPTEADVPHGGRFSSRRSLSSLHEFAEESTRANSFPRVIAFGPEWVQGTFATRSCALNATGFRAIMTGLPGTEVRCTWATCQGRVPRQPSPLGRRYTSNNIVSYGKVELTPSPRSRSLSSCRSSHESWSGSPM